MFACKLGATLLTSSKVLDMHVAKCFLEQNLEPI